MKYNTLKKVLSMLLVICMMASFSGCIPGEEDPTEPSTSETTSPTESTTAPTDAATAPTDSMDATTFPTEETQLPTTPTEAETNPPTTEAPSTDPTFATEIPTESPVETFVDVVEKVYAIANVNVRSGPSTDDMLVGSLSYGESVQRTGIGNKGWSRIDYNGAEAYVYASYLSTTNPAQDTSGYPKTYSDATCDITPQRNGMKMPGATSLTSSSQTTPGSVLPVPTASMTAATKPLPMQPVDWMPSSL